MTLSANDAMILQMVGFTDREIKEFADAKTPEGKPQPPINLNSPVWIKVMEARMAKAGQIRTIYHKTHKKKLARSKYEQLVNLWYSKSKANPWDWLKLIYIPKKKTDFGNAVRNRAARKLSNMQKIGRIK